LIKLIFSRGFPLVKLGFPAEFLSFYGKSMDGEN
jgi:hypothetical protein